MVESCYEVEAIIGQRNRSGEIKYLVKWLGYPKDKATWEPIEHLYNCLPKVAQYYEAIELKSIRQIIDSEIHNGHKYFQISFNGEEKNRRIDYETAKYHFAEDIIDFFASRSQWTSTDINSNVSNGEPNADRPV
ncbi:M-phase phosphoprotein 8-like isoform X3 [Contarinia nasturtii]|uniref:M-phase phosphoprotein 8-like isoform X3 n=1 Tax=Contarinia nasturtii TaxID=265458 RepID=UPI0012D4AABD|nr:M-phase phosphoprotein 8-like isoform X3 [Contarinia nasturtii]